MINVGDKAPDFLLPTGDGTRVQLSDFKGKKVVLYFYPKDNTPGCTKEACSFQENIIKLKQKGAIVLGVSVDSESSHAKFSEKYGLTFPLLSDKNKEVVKKYGVWKLKSMFGKKFFGVERTTFIIDERGTIQKIFSNVKVEGHIEQVIQSL